MKGKKILLTGLTIALLNSPFLLPTDQAIAKQQTVHTVKTDLTATQAIQLASNFSKDASYVQRGGDYKSGEYKTFTYKGKTYRYLSSSIDTMKELHAFMEKTLTHTATMKFIKESNLITYKGKLAQIEADGGSLLQWQKATAQLIKSEKNKKVYRLTVPIGETKESSSYTVEYHDVEKVGWRLSKEPTFEQNVLTNSLAVDLAYKLAQASSYVQRGGDYKSGEYQTFTYNGKTYRYLSSQIDTKGELLNYLTNSLTPSAAEQFIKAKGIIEYNGRLAQLEADGGSLLQWQKATAQLIKSEKNTHIYLLSVPVGDTSEKQDYLVEYQNVQNIGWRISKEPYWNLDIPGNVNPAYNFYRLVLVDSNATRNLFLNSFNVEAFKQGVKKLEYKNMTEIGRSSSQVEYIVKFNAELDSNYKGKLVNGENTMYFAVQPVGYMDFKIAKMGYIELY